MNPNAPAIITVDYTESNIDHFDANQTYYGCLLADKNAEASLPMNCVITAVGKDEAGNVVATQDFTYTVPALAVAAPMMLGKFGPGFRGLGSLEFSVNNNLTIAGLLDNLIALLYEIPSAAFYPATPAQPVLSI